MQIDLVVCNTRVDVHYELIKPSLMKGKSVYCEWPLASNLTDAKELQALAEKHRARTMVGLQGELTPIVLKVKSLIEEEDKIGKVLSSTVVAAGLTRTRDTLPEGLKYFTEKRYGGNMVTIGIGHSEYSLLCMTHSPRDHSPILAWGFGFCIIHWLAELNTLISTPRSARLGRTSPWRTLIGHVQIKHPASQKLPPRSQRLRCRDSQLRRSRPCDDPRHTSLRRTLIIRLPPGPTVQRDSWLPMADSWREGRDQGGSCVYGDASGR